MGDSINTRQNEAYNIDRLAAQRFIYSRAKKLRIGQALISYGLVVLGSVVATAVRYAVSPTGPTPNWIVCVCGLVALLANFGLKNWIARSVVVAARIQEMFDCDVLDLPWNRHMVGSQVDAELIAKQAATFRTHGGDVVKLRDWYMGDFAATPLPVARLVCQRQNMMWDCNLRSAYVRYVEGVGAGVLCLLLAMGLVRDMSLGGFLIGMLPPAAPVLVFMWQEARENMDRIGNLRRVQVLLHECWGKVIAGHVEAQTLQDDARRIQDCIFLHRKAAPLIVDILYWRKRSAQQRECGYSANEMLRQYRQAARFQCASGERQKELGKEVADITRSQYE